MHLCESAGLYSLKESVSRECPSFTIADDDSLIEMKMIDDSIKPFLPYGCLGILRPSDIEVTDTIPKEALGLVADYMSGSTGTMEFANRIESVRLRLSAVQPPSMQP
jgi:hypothetical protein